MCTSWMSAPRILGEQCSGSTRRNDFLAPRSISHKVLWLSFLQHLLESPLSIFPLDILLRAYPFTKAVHGGWNSPVFYLSSPGWQRGLLHMHLASPGIWVDMLMTFSYYNASFRFSGLGSTKDSLPGEVGLVSLVASWLSGRMGTSSSSFLGMVLSHWVTLLLYGTESESPSVQL